MSDETTLLPCPFCGCVAMTLLKGHVIDMRYSVGCQDDECRGFIGLSWLYKTEAEAIAAWNTRTHGTLTAEQVREAIEEAKAELLESCEYVGDMYQRQSDVLKAFGKMEQAIADELNAERHVETCENMREKFGYKRLFVCSECGVTFDPDCEINYCPWCGREVVG